MINRLDDDMNDVQFVGLQNKRNNCWLNSLVQCLNSLPLRLRLLDEIKEKMVSEVTSALMNVISRMEYASSSKATLYPSELH